MGSASSRGSFGITPIKTELMSLEKLIALLHVGDIIVLPDERYGIVTTVHGSTVIISTVVNGIVRELDVAGLVNEAKIDNSFDEFSEPYSIGKTVENAESFIGQSYIYSSQSFVRRCRNGN